MSILYEVGLWYVDLIIPGITACTLGDNRATTVCTASDNRGNGPPGTLRYFMGCDHYSEAPARD